MDLNLENHSNSCRICITQFEIEDVEIKITKKVQEMYLCLTGIDVSIKIPRLDLSKKLFSASATKRGRLLEHDLWTVQ